MKKYVFLFLMILFSAVTSLSCFASGRPDWISSSQKSYPSSDYIAAVGSGKDRTAAESSAKLALSQILGESISGQQTVTQQANSTGYEESSIDISVTEQAVFDHLTGIEIKKTYTDKKGVVYAIAVLSRKNASQYYTAKINEADLKISRALSTALKNRGTIACIGALSTALDAAVDNEYNLDLLAVINPQQRQLVSLSYGSAQQVRTRRNDMAAEVKVGVAVQGDDDGRIAAAFSSVFRDEGLTVVPAADAPYILSAVASFEDASLPDSQYQFVRYSLNAPLTDHTAGTTLLPFTLSGREGHVTTAQAKKRAILKIEEAIQSEYGTSFKKMLSSY